MIASKKHIHKISILALVGMFFLFACGNSNEDINAMQQSEKLPQLISTKIVIEYSDSARLKARVISPLLKEYGPPENHTVLPRGVDVYFYDPSGKLSSTMHADSAVIRRNSDLMEAYQNVVVKNTQGEQLKTQSLFWRNSQNQADRELYTYDFVTIFKGDEVIYGEGLNANESFTKYRITHPQGEMHMPEENQP